MRTKKLFKLGAIFALGVILTTGYFQDRAPVSAATNGLTLTVNDAADLPDAKPGDGVCLTANQTCTLRAAIMESNKHQGTDVIHLQANATYVLTRAGDDNNAKNGDLDINEGVQIIGNGATIDANSAVTHDRAIHLPATKKQHISYFKNLTVKGGSTTTKGGGIWNQSFLLAEYITVTTNQAGGEGGGIANDGTMFARYSTIEYNTCACASVGGGGIANHGPLVLYNSTINNNNSHFDGGGIWTDGSDVTVVAGTMANNLANRHGGGIHNQNTNLILAHSTIAYNFADADHDNVGYAGGVNNVPPGKTTLAHTILAKNGNAENILWKWDDCHGAIDSLGYNLIYHNNNCVVSLSQNLVGFEPSLGTFNNYGGPTKTIALNANSIAIDAGNPNNCALQNSSGMTFDQRNYQRIVDGNGDNKPVCDMGAFEYQSTPIADSCTSKPPTPLVNVTANNPQINPAQAVLGFTTDCAETYNVIVRQDTKKGPAADKVQGLALGMYLTETLTKGHTYYARATACNAHGCEKSKWKKFVINP